MAEGDGTYFYHSDSCRRCSRALAGRVPLSKCYVCAYLFCSSQCLEGHREQYHGRDLSHSVSRDGRGTKRAVEDGER